VLGMQDVNSGVDDEANEGKRKAEHDEGTSSTSVIRGEGENQKHDGTRNVGSDGVKIGLYDRIAEALDDLGKEEGDGLEWDTEADFDG